MKKANRLTRKKNSAGYLFILPWIIGFCLFTAYPLFDSIWLSFNKVLISPDGIITDFLGIDNFTYAFAIDPNFNLSLGSYIYQSVLTVPMVLIFSIVLALMLNKKIPLRRFFRAIYFLPVVLISGPVLNELNANGANKISGMKQFVVYHFISTLPSYISSPLTYIFDNIISILWFSGVQIILFMIGLQKADKSIYEAAQVDGASGWEQFWKITLPMLKPFILINAIYTIVDVSSITSPIIKYILDNMNDPKTGYGYSSAVALIYLIVIILLIAVCYLIFGRGDTLNRKVSGRKKT